MDFVNSALPTLQGYLWTTLAEHALIVFPYVEGVTVMERGLPDERWPEVGRILASLHTTRLAEQLQHELRRERFVPPRAESARRVIEYAHADGLDGSAAELARFVRSKADEMRAIIERAEELGQIVRTKQPGLVLCHGDPNQANILLAPDGRLLLIDWDGVSLAPVERDLMFFTGAEHELFMQGYAAQQKITPDPVILAYYKYEWVVQEFHDYGTRLFFTPNLSVLERQHALQEFSGLFAPEDVVQGAYAADKEMLSS